MPMSFLTCIYGVFEYQNVNNTPQVTFTFSKAGHPLPILYRAASGDVVELKSRGILIGMLDEINNENSRVVLNKGDRIYLYTDGIPETMNAEGKMFGFDTLPKLIKGMSGCSLSEMLDYVIEELNIFRGKTSLHDDDIVLIGIEIA
jgi:sigma-B regulation protein RsbU (phosphoserine phosphatase)